MVKGWRNESRRHSLARRGVKTATTKSCAVNKVPVKSYSFRVRELEAEGLTTSDAQGIADGEFKVNKVKDSFYSEIYSMSGEWYYVIRDKNDKLVYSSDLNNKKDIEQFARRRTNLLNAQEDIKKNFPDKIDKNYNVQHNIGRAKYVVNSYSGKKNDDGSDFYDIAIFKNKKDLEKYEKELSSKGYRVT